jgi:flagellar FliJ protein
LFQFSLEAVLKIRTRKLERAQLALANEMRIEAELTRRLDEAIVANRAGRADLVRMLAEGLAVNEFLLRHAYLEGLRKRSADLAAELASSQQSVSLRRKELVEADRDKRVVEKLKEKAWQRYQEEERQREFKLLDEFSVIGFNRARRQESAER